MRKKKTVILVEKGKKEMKCKGSGGGRINWSEYCIRGGLGGKKRRLGKINGREKDGKE